MSVQKNPDSRMLGRREIVNGKVHITTNIFCVFCLTSIICNLFSLYLMITLIGFSLQPGKYVWQTYKEVYDLVVKVGNSIRSCGIEEVSGKIAKFLLLLLFLICYLIYVFSCAALLFMLLFWVSSYSPFCICYCYHIYRFLYLWQLGFISCLSITVPFDLFDC